MAPQEDSSITLSARSSNIDVPEFVPCITGCHPDETTVNFVVIKTTATVGWCSHSDMFSIYSSEAVGIIPQLP